MTSPARTILHADMDAFYASIEQRDHPELRGKPVIIGGMGKRGVVSTASYEARKFGVHSALPASIAHQRCPHGIFLPTRMAHYAAVSRQIMDVFARYTPLVEPLSLDEAFMDVTDSETLFGSGETIAKRIQDDVRDVTQLSVSIGVAASKSVAKIASDLRKPEGLVVVPSNTELMFLAPLPLAMLWGAGKRTQERFAARGMSTIGDVQDLSIEELREICGEGGAEHYWHLARGLDDRGVSPAREARSISHETTFRDDVADRDALHAVLLDLSEAVGRRLRKHGLKGTTVKLKLRYPPFQTLSRQAKVESPTWDDTLVYQCARDLLDATRTTERPVRLLGVGVSDLVAADDVGQTQLFGARDERMLETLDAIKDRFGEGAVRRSSSSTRRHDRGDEIYDPVD